MYKTTISSIKTADTLNRDFFTDLLRLGWWGLAMFFSTTVVQAQTAITSANAASFELQSSVDNILAGLPGVLLAGLAFIFAIKQHKKAQQLTLENDDKKAMLDNCNIGLWKIDRQGKTVYLNAPMCAMLGIENVAALTDTMAENALLVNNQNTDSTTPYRAQLRQQNSPQIYDVLICESAFPLDQSVTLRKVILINDLPAELLETVRLNTAA